MKLATPYATPAHYPAILAAESRILSGRPVPDAPPLRWNTTFLGALGAVACEARLHRQKDAGKIFKMAAQGAAATALIALRCVLADGWEFPETDPETMPARPRLPEAERPGAVELVATYDNPAAMVRPRHADEFLEEVSACWCAWVAQAEVVRFYHTGEAEASELWRADRTLQEEDLGDMLDLLGAACGAAFDLCAAAEFGAVLFA